MANNDNDHLDESKVLHIIGAAKRSFEKAADFHPQFFPAEIGLDAQKYYQRKPTDYAGVKFYAEQGAIHGVHARVVPGDGGGVQIAIEHWVHRPNGDNIVTPVLSIDAVPATQNSKAVIRISKVELQGEAVDINDRRTVNAAVSTAQQILEILRQERRMPLVNKISSTTGLKLKPLPDTYRDGNARLAYESGRKNTIRALRIPPQFVPAVTGFFEEGYEANPDMPVQFNALTRQTGKKPLEFAMRGEMRTLPVLGSANVALVLARKSTDSTEAYIERDVARLRFRPVRSGRDKNLIELSYAEMDARGQRPSDHKNMVRILHFAHDAMLDVRQGLLPDLAEIISYTNTQKAMSGTPPLTKAEGQRHIFRVLGGSPTADHLSAQEKGIGANCFAHRFEKFDAKGNFIVKSLVVDCGIMSLNRDKSGYDGKMAFAGDYYRHRDNTKHKPKYEAEATFITHWHYDHDGGVPHMLLAGYVMDHVICNEATKIHIEDICKKLDVPKEWMPKKWTVIDSLIEDKEELIVGDDFTLSFGWTPHSAPTSWINVKTPEGSVFHFSDAKVDPNIKSHPGFDFDRMAELKPTAAIVDCTRAAYTGVVKHEIDIENEMVDFINKDPDKAPIVVQFSTNTARMTTTADAYGRTNRDMVVFGTSMRFTKKVMDKVGRREGKGLKEYASDTFGRRILNYSANAKGANDILRGDARSQGLLITGPGNEPMSIVNRLIEDKDQKNLGFINPYKYKFILSQTPPPGSERGYNKLTDFLTRRGFEYIVAHTSGHGGQADVIEMLKKLGARVGISTHGNAQQRIDGAKIVKNLGMDSIDPSEQDEIQISDTKGCKVIGQEKSMMTFFSLKRPKDQHYGGGEDVEYLTEIAEPEIKSATGKMIREIAAIRAESGIENTRLRLRRQARDEKDPTLNIDGVDLRPRNRRVEQSLPDYYIRNGFLRELTYDLETTQLGKYAWIHQFAGLQTDLLDPKNRTWINFYQILPRSVLPDLNALLKTGVLPSELYREPDGSRQPKANLIFLSPPPAGSSAAYPPRMFYHAIKKVLSQSKCFEFQRQDEQHKHAAYRLWFDAGVKPNDPSRRTAGNRAKGDAAYLEKSIDFTLDPLARAQHKSPRMVNIKTMLNGFNIFGADNVWVQHAAFRAGDIRYSPMNSGGIRSSDIRHKARMFAYLRPDKFKVRQKPDNPEFLDFTVEGLMKSNNLRYERAHEGRGDVAMENQLDQFMLAIDPELYTRMTMNANPKEIKKYFAGTHNGMVYPRHLLTYVNRNAYGASANIGVYVGRSTDKKYMNKAVLFNVSDFDPKEFMGVGPQEIAEIMADRTHRLHKAFEIVDINKQPLIASVDRGLAVGANRGSSMEQMKGYKHFLERNPDIAANMIKAMEIARHLPDHDHRRPLEERIYAPEFMEMSAHDKAVAKLFIPCDEEFSSAAASHRINRERASALDTFHNKQLRERYVAVMYQVERESEILFGKSRRYLHPTDHARMKAREKARIHGRGDNDSMSLGRLQKQIADATANWDELMKGKTPKEKDHAKKILAETKVLADWVDQRIRDGDPDWAMTQEDLKLLGLDDNVNYAAYSPPVARNPNAPRPPRAA